MRIKQWQNYGGKTQRHRQTPQCMNINQTEMMQSGIPGANVNNTTRRVQK